MWDRGKKKIAKKILKCFKGVIFDSESFTFNGVQVTASKGTETKFYQKGEIDKGIDKLNKLIKYYLN